LPGTNNPAYLKQLHITDVKSFIKFSPDTSIISFRVC
jgi:hypothetical protein